MAVVPPSSRTLTASCRNATRSRLSPLSATIPSSTSVLHWCHLHGLVVAAPTPSLPQGTSHAPVTLRPSPFPSDSFAAACALQPHFQAMADAVSRDDDYLEDVLSGASREDAFIAALMDVWRTGRRRGRAPGAIRLGIMRSDYMEASTGKVLQVELNTMSCSFAALGGKVTALHRRMAEGCGDHVDGLPDNMAGDGVVRALAVAASEWEAQEGYGDRTSVVIFVVQPGENNVYDQAWLADMIWETYGVRTVRASLGEIAACASTDDNGTLKFQGEAVSVVYFRAGYTPDDYPTDVEWEARRIIECSNAVSCPDAAHHLAGSKKIQQDLARPGSLERFVPDAATASRMRESFAGLWSFDDLTASETQRIISHAISKPEEFVLKPQREGGGNNVYGEELAMMLRGGEGLEAYILMERIRPPVYPCHVMRNGETQVVDAVSELGIFGWIMARGGGRGKGNIDIMYNVQQGHLLRTKMNSSDEGGVAAGYAFLDSPLLVPR